MAHKDPVSPELRELVIKRDRVCFLYRLDPTHVCQDRYGPHPPYDQNKLTVDHFHMDGAHMGKRAPSSPETLTAMCWLGNFRNPSRAVREKQREYSRSIYGDQPV